MNFAGKGKTVFENCKRVFETFAGLGFSAAMGKKLEVGSCKLAFAGVGEGFGGVTIFSTRVGIVANKCGQPFNARWKGENRCWRAFNGRRKWCEQMLRGFRRAFEG